MTAIGTLLVWGGILVAILGIVRPKIFARKGAEPPNRRSVFSGGMGILLVGAVIWSIGTFQEIKATSPLAKAQLNAETTQRTEPEPDVSEIVNALTLLQLKKLQKLGSSSASWCTDEKIDGNLFIGCYPKSLTSRGLTALYLVSQTDTGTTAISPINGTAMGALQNRSGVPKVDGGSFPISAYRGPSIDIPSILKHFE